MSMTLKDFNQLKACMNMTESGAEAEVLAAIKRANAILVKYGYDWDAVFRKLVTLEVEAVQQDENATVDRRAPPRTGGRSPPVYATVDAATVNRRFEQAFERVDPSSSFHATISDIQAKWEQYGRITVNQFGVIERAATDSRR